MKRFGQTFTNFFIRVLASRKFSVFVVLLFVFQALWIALSFRYSMIYDEYYHFGLIEYFSHQLSPWINNQPTSLDQYGALGRNPYLLYHYVLSFPFRLVALFTDSMQLQIIAMRVINISLFATGLVVFGRLFKSMKVPRIFRNVALLLFVLLPVTPFVAATVNYDNAVFLLTAILLYFGIKIIKSPTLNWSDTTIFITIGLVGCMTKLSFLPIFAATLAFLAWNALSTKGLKSFTELKASFISSSVTLKILILLPAIVTLFLFAASFGVNVLQYRSLSPSCVTQMSESRCSKNYVESRANDLNTRKNGIPVQVPQYTSSWVTTMQEGLLVTGANKEGKFGTVMAKPLPVIYAVVFIMSFVSIFAFFYRFDKIKKLTGFYMLTSVVVLYVLSLFYLNITEYYKYYQPIAIQGRYLIPLVPILILFGILGLNYLLERALRMKLMLFLIVMVLFLNGAGLITHIVRSEESWNWNNETVREVNKIARNFLRPVVKVWWYDR